MAAVGTAELVEDTAVTDEALPGDALPETDELEEAPETDQQESPETEELAEDDPRVVPLLEARETAHKAELASINESYRRREENARIAGRTEAYRQIQESVSRVDLGGVTAELARMLDKAADEGEKPDAKVVENLVRAAATAGQLTQPETMLAITNTLLKKDFGDFYKAAPEREDLNNLWADSVATGNPYESFLAALRLTAIAGEEKGYAKGKADAEKALAEKAKASAKSEQIKAAGAAARNETGPTSVAGIGRPGRVLTMAQIDAMPTREWMALPQEERNRLREAALNLAAKGRR